MIKASASTIILRPREIVFNTAADPQQQLIWDKKHFTKLEVLTPGPIAVGSQYKCFIPWMGTMWYEFVELQPHDFFAHRSKMLLSYGYHRLEFTTVPGGTKFTQTMEVRPRGLGFLLYPFLKMLLKRSLNQIISGLKSYMEKDLT